MRLRGELYLKCLFGYLTVFIIKIHVSAKLCLENNGNIKLFVFLCNYNFFNQHSEIGVAYCSVCNNLLNQLRAIRFISTKPNVARCKCCERYFMPKARNETLYCDRIIRDGKFCKQLVPALNHKLAAKKPRVIEEYGRANQRMYKFYERTANYNQKPSAVDLTYAQYYKWRDAAAKARDEFLAGKIPEEDALKIIMK